MISTVLDARSSRLEGRIKSLVREGYENRQTVLDSFEAIYAEEAGGEFLWITFSTLLYLYNAYRLGVVPAKWIPGKFWNNYILEVWRRGFPDLDCLHKTEYFSRLENLLNYAAGRIRSEAETSRHFSHLMEREE